MTADSPALRAPRYRFLFSDELVLERIDDKDSGTAYRIPRKTGLQARIRGIL